ncbi:hypothetical protein TWF128_004372 [Orbilia oligospora]|nr:hypothetical protein TWF128_004372 [Orbilia oligospora]
MLYNFIQIPVAIRSEVQNSRRPASKSRSAGFLMRSSTRLVLRLPGFRSLLLDWRELKRKVSPSGDNTV